MAGRQVRSHQRKQTLAAAGKAKRAAELTMQGWTLKAIAKELGYKTPSGVSMLLEYYRLELPRESLERLRDMQLARLESVITMALDDAHHKSASVRDKAQKRIIAAVQAQARISGTVKAPPPVVIVQQEQAVDLSRLSVDEVESLQGIQRKLLEPAITVKAEVVDETQSG